MSHYNRNIQVASPDDLANSFYVYHFDEAYTRRNRIASFKGIINYLLLLAERIVILDSFVLNNDILTKFLEETGYAYLQEGLIVPARRSVNNDIGTFKSLHERQEQNRHIYLTNNHLHVQRLDQFTQKCVLWDLENVAENFENTLYILRDRVYDETSFRQLPGFCELSADDFLNSMFTYAESDKDQLNDRFLARIHFDHAIASHSLPKKKAEALKQFIDAVHFSMMPQYLSLSSFYPNEFERELGPIRDLDSYADMVANRGEIQVDLLDSVELPTIDIAVLERLDIEDIMAIRATSEFASYKKLMSEPINLDLGVIKRYYDTIQELILDPRGFARRHIAQSSRFMLWKSKHGLIATIIEQIMASVPQLAVLQGIVLHLTSKSFEHKTSALRPLLNRQLISGVDLGKQKVVLHFDKALRRNSRILLPLPK